MGPAEAAMSLVDPVDSGKLSQLPFCTVAVKMIKSIASADIDRRWRCQVSSSRRIGALQPTATMRARKMRSGNMSEAAQ